MAPVLHAAVAAAHARQPRKSWRRHVVACCCRPFFPRPTTPPRGVVAAESVLIFAPDAFIAPPTFYGPQLPRERSVAARVPRRLFCRYRTLLSYARPPQMRYSVAA